MASNYLKDKYSIWEQITADDYHAAQTSMPPNEFWNTYQQSSHFGYPVFYKRRNPNDDEILAIIADGIIENSKINTDQISKEIKKVKTGVVVVGALSIATFTIIFLIFWSEYLYWLY